MKTTVIYRGEPIEVPSFHAERLIRADKAKLPKVRGSGNAQPSDAVPAIEPPTTQTVADPQTRAKQEAPADQGAPKQDAAPVPEDGTARRRYTRRDMKAQD